jgi:hypothetical protein
MDASASKLRIANRACIEMGVKTISAPNDGSSSANIIFSNGLYDDCRQEFLEEHPWSFSTVTVALATLSQVPIDFGDGCLIAYAFPVQCLSIYKLNFPNAKVYQQNLNGQNVIISDTAGLIIKYTIDNDDPTTYSAKARLALAFKIASSAYFKLVEGGRQGELLRGMYEKALMSAISDDSKGSTPDQVQADNIFYERIAGANSRVGVPGDSNSVNFFSAGF